MDNTTEALTVTRAVELTEYKLTCRVDTCQAEFWSMSPCRQFCPTCTKRIRDELDWA